MKTFNKKENEEIYIACNTLRATIVVFSSKEALRTHENYIGSTANMAGRGSLVYDLVQDKNWDTLFKNRKWLSFLALAENVNVLVDGELSKFIKTISKYFGEETDGYLFPR